MFFSPFIFFFLSFFISFFYNFGPQLRSTADFAPPMHELYSNVSHAHCVVGLQVLHEQS